MQECRPRVFVSSPVHAEGVRKGDLGTDTGKGVPRILGVQTKNSPALDLYSRNRYVLYQDRVNNFGEPIFQVKI